jgi:uncharacterized protein YhbP (UPF0306 family)
MLLPEKRIVDLIKKHHVLTLATSCDNLPWCAHCFYTYIEEKNWLVFTSETTTKHVQDTLAQPQVAGGIVLETMNVGKIRGIQLRGIMRQPSEAEAYQVKTAYLKRFPFAVLMNISSLWIVEINYIKMTDNRLGFGKKAIWNKET